MNPMIWVIDDDASIRFVFDKALDVNSINHRLFENAEAALEAIKKETAEAAGIIDVDKALADAAVASGVEDNSINIGVKKEDEEEEY